MRIKKRSVILIILVLFLAIFLIYPATIATRTYAWFNYMSDNVKEVVDLSFRGGQLLLGGEAGYRLAYNVGEDTTFQDSINLKLAKMGAQFVGEYYIEGAAHKEGAEKIGWMFFLYGFLLPVAALRMYRAKSLNRSNLHNFPNLPNDKFEIYRGYIDKSINSFFWATWGTFIVSVVIGIIVAPFFIQPGSPGIFLFVMFSAILIWFILGMIDSLKYGTKAAKLKKSFEKEIKNGVNILKAKGKAKFSVLAVTGLVFALIGLILGVISGVVGFILGLVALKSINRSRGEIKGKGIAIAAVIVSAVSIVYSVMAVWIWHR